MCDWQAKKRKHNHQEEVVSAFITVSAFLNLMIFVLGVAVLGFFPSRGLWLSQKDRWQRSNWVKALGYVPSWHDVWKSSLSFCRWSALAIRIWRDSVFCHLHSLIVQMWILQNKLIMWTFSIWDSKLGFLRPELCFVDMQSPRILCPEFVWVILHCELFLARNFVYQKSKPCWLGN